MIDLILGGFQGEWADIQRILEQNSKRFPVAGEIQPPANDPGQPTPQDFSVVSQGRGSADYSQFQFTDRDIAGLDIYSDWRDRQFEEEQIRRNTAAVDAAAKASMWPCW